MNKEYDYIIVGAVIIGLSTAYKLALKFPKKTILVLEKERELAKHQTGNNSGALSSFFKFYGTELNIARQELLMALSGTEALIWEKNNKSDGDLARKFCRSKGNSIEGGTSEIQLNIISKLILGLPNK